MDGSDQVRVEGVYFAVSFDQWIEPFDSSEYALTESIDQGWVEGRNRRSDRRRTERGTLERIGLSKQVETRKGDVRSRGHRRKALPGTEVEDALGHRGSGTPLEELMDRVEARLAAPVVGGRFGRQGQE